MAPNNPRCTIGTKINTRAVHVTSISKCLRRYGANKKTRIIVGTVLEVEIRTKATALGSRRTFVVEKFDLGGGDMKVATINIRSVKLHTPEPLPPATNSDGGERAAAATTTTTGDTTITDPVSVQVFKAPAQYPLNDEAFIVVVTHPMSETYGYSLSPLTKADGSEVGAVLAHLWVHLLWRCLHLIHFLDYFHFLNLFHFLYLILHCLPYRIRVLHLQSAVTLDKDLRLCHIQKVRKVIVMGENSLRTIVVLNKTSMVLIHYANGS